MIRNLIKWAISNSPSMNLVFLAVMGLGVFSVMGLRRELFPEFKLDAIEVSMGYPGASPKDVEESICQKVEEAVRSVDGISKVVSVAAEGMAAVTLELQPGRRTPQETLNDVRSAIDQIQTFPQVARNPNVKLVTRKDNAIRIGLVSHRDSSGTLAELRQVGEKIREGLLQISSVSDVTLEGVPDYQIDVEISEKTLSDFQLTLRDIALIVQRENHQMPGGVLRSPEQELLLRGNNKRTTGDEIANLPIVSQQDGTVITLSDLGEVKDGFADSPMLCRINGKPSIALSVKRSTSEDLIALVEEVNRYLAHISLPEGFELVVWNDASVPVKERLELLTKNGLVGVILVLIVLALFLEVRLAFWVAMGIPFSVLTACSVLLCVGESLNMVSTFAFLIALGVVVDDAIVVGENVYAHRQMGKSSVQAAIDGTAEVLPAVCVSVLTTVIAFMPMFFVSGTLGKFIWIMPTAIIAMLLGSLFESLTVLPSHLAHEKTIVFRVFSVVFAALKWLLIPLNKLNQWCSGFLEYFIERVYLPSLKIVLRWRMICLVVSCSLLVISFGFVATGRVPFVIFSDRDSTTVGATIEFPAGTPFTVTNKWTDYIMESFQRSLAKSGQESAVKTQFVLSGAQASGEGGQGGSVSSNKASVEIELVDRADRNLSSQQIISNWRKETGQIPGIQSLRFNGSESGPGGTAIQFSMLAGSEYAEQLDAAKELAKRYLKEYGGVFDVRDDASIGKWELQYRVKKDAMALGVRPADLAETVRATYFGEEVMRLQRGRHEVTLMVRYPEDERTNLRSMSDVKVKSSGGVFHSLGDIAELKTSRGYSAINRINQRRSITVSADVDQTVGNAQKIVRDFKTTFLPKIQEMYPEVTVSWDGQQKQEEESFGSLFWGFGFAVVAMFLLLSFQFRSYLQPFLILAIIPFGMIGAIWGHYLLGMPLTFFSILGIVALTGVVVNDSIVLVDFINSKAKKGKSLEESILESGKRRFRPVMLTSLTTIVGVLPMLLEKSEQAQMLIPMAASLSFGLMVATVWVLVLVPLLCSFCTSLDQDHPHLAESSFG